MAEFKANQCHWGQGSYGSPPNSPRCQLKRDPKKPHRQLCDKHEAMWRVEAKARREARNGGNVVQMPRTRAAARKTRTAASAKARGAVQARTRARTRTARASTSRAERDGTVQAKRRGRPKKVEAKS